MITQGSTAHPVQLNDHFFGDIIKEVHWGGKPPMIIITGQDETLYGTLSGSRTTVNVFTEIVWFVVSFAADDNGHHIWATVKCDGVFATDINLISTDPVLPTTADFTGYVPFDGAWVPIASKDPGYSFNSRIADYDYSLPVTLVPTKLAKVRLYRRGTAAQSLVNSVYGAQGRITFPRDIVTSVDVSFEEGSFAAGDTIPAGTYHDVGFRSIADLTSEVSAYPATQVTITVYKDGTFKVDPTRGSIGQKGAVTVTGGTVLAHDIRSYPVFTVGNLVEFNNKGIVV